MDNNLSNEKKKIHTPLKAGEIDVRVMDINPDKGTFGIYLKVDPRIVMDKLDEKFGPMGWNKETIVEVIDGKPVAKTTISAQNDKGDWISRDDHSGGAAWADDQEAKVLEADALCRCAVQFGIGRELYSFKNMTGNLCDKQGNQLLDYFEVEGKFYSKDKLYVEQISYDENYRINALSIKNATNNVRFCEDRRENTLQSTIVDGENDTITLKDAKNVKADIGALSEKTLGELSGQQIAYIWSNTKNKDIKKAALVVAASNKEAKEILKRQGVKI